MSREEFTGYKRPSDIVDFYIDCSDEFALTDPADQIDTATWAVESGDVVIDSYRVEGTDQAIARVSGGTKLWTSTCVSGQVYTPLIRIQLVR
jgi:hypothetical protein